MQIDVHAPPDDIEQYVHHLVTSQLGGMCGFDVHYEPDPQHPGMVRAVGVAWLKS